VRVRDKLCGADACCAAHLETLIAEKVDGNGGHVLRSNCERGLTQARRVVSFRIEQGGAIEA
jgi:hypothetical protein